MFGLSRKRHPPREPSAEPDAASLARAFAAGASNAGFALDPSQARAAELLAGIAARRAGGFSRGLYLWGPVGRGKTWLMDVFFDAVGGPKRRFHFHRFFRDLHVAMHRHPPGPAAMSRALDDLLGDATIVCFDELHVHEPGDGGLVIRLLTELLVDRPLTLVVTSNYHPDGLLPTAVLPHSGGAFEEPVKVRHEYFLPGIHLIKASMDIVAVDGGHDYRIDAGVLRRTGFRSGFYIEPRDAQEAMRTGLLAPPEPVAINVGTNRTLRAQHSSGGTVGFEFDDLCERYVGAGDVVELTAQFDSWVIYNVPPLERCSPEGAQRLVNFVDVLHDADLRLTITSSVTLEDLVAGRRVPADVARLRSRLTLLRRPGAATGGQQ